MTTAKFSANITETHEVSDITCTERTSRVDLRAIKDSANTLLGKGVAFAWAWKFAVHGLKLKASDYVQYKSKRMTAEEFQAIIRSKNNHCTTKQVEDKDGKGLGKESDKRSVTATRLVRAFAADITAFIKKGAVVPEELSSLADEANLPVHYAFLDAGYGMDDETLRDLAGPMYEFAEAFDAQIQEAYSSGWIETAAGSTRHSHAADFKNYCKWRSLTLEFETEETEPPAPAKAPPAAKGGKGVKSK